jgi:hypothetical protein
MKLTLRYIDIDHTMEKLIVQVKESIPFMRSFLPDWISSPEDLFSFLKPQLIFTPDPPETELLQTSQTLFTDNYHGIAGAGDCDCFSITGLAACYVLQIPAKIVLAGRSKIQPVHIYLRVMNREKWIPFDLTEAEINSERFYPLKNDYFVPFLYKDQNKEKNNCNEFQIDSIKRKKYFQNYLES